MNKYTRNKKTFNPYVNYVQDRSNDSVLREIYYIFIGKLLVHYTN